VTKTNRFTLIATILLGVLLYTILRFAHDLNIAWDGSALKPPPANNDSPGLTQPRLATTADLLALLDTEFAGQGLDARAALDATADWSNARGFTGNDLLPRLPDTAPSAPFTPGDDAELVVRSEAGQAAASQALAAQTVFTDPFLAIELFHKAAEQGSTFALLRIGSLLEALDTAGAGAEAANAIHRERVTELAQRGVGNSLRLTALGYVITAIRDGGAPIVDQSMLTWLDRLKAEATNDELVAVCAWSERTLLEIAKSRARSGKPPVTTTAPPVFLTITELTDRLPCRQTAHPIENLQDLTNCSITNVRNAADEPMDLYLCPGNQIS